MSVMTSLSSQKKRQGGFTLIEAMVALMILSIGMVGLAYLQATGMRLTSTSNTRTQAAILAADLMDRIRSHGYANIGDFDNITIANTNGTPPETCDATSTAIEDEITCWSESVERSLTDPDVLVSVNDDVVTIQMTWTEAKLRDETPNNADDDTIEQDLTFTAQILDNG